MSGVFPKLTIMFTMTTGYLNSYISRHSLVFCNDVQTNTAEDNSTLPLDGRSVCLSVTVGRSWSVGRGNGNGNGRSVAVTVGRSVALWNHQIHICFRHQIVLKKVKIKQYQPGKLTVTKLFFLYDP